MMSNDILVETVHEIQEETDVLLSVICMATLGGLVSWLRQKGPRKWSRLIVKGSRDCSHITLQVLSGLMLNISALCRASRAMAEGLSSMTASRDLSKLLTEVISLHERKKKNRGNVFYHCPCYLFTLFYYTLMFIKIALMTLCPIRSL